jgi:F-type H+-transporting ATPase subunit b
MSFKYIIRLAALYYLFSFSISATEGMPQFNAKTFPSQIFWLVITFSILYALVTWVLLPRIRENIRLRKNKVSNNLERSEAIKNDIEKMINEYELKIYEAKENVSSMIKKSILKSSDEFNAQINTVKKQIEIKQKEVESNLSKYKNKIEENTIDASASVAVQIINKIISKKITTEDIKPLFKNINQSDKG